MDVEAIIKDLEWEWDRVPFPVEGFFAKLYDGEIDEEGFQRVLGIIDSIHFEEDESLISKRLVELLWFMPTFVHWQEPQGALTKEEIEAFEKRKKDIASTFEGRLTSVLGLP